MAEPKSFHLSAEIHSYLTSHSTPIDDIQRDLIAETAEATGGFARMQIAPEQGVLMTLLTRVLRVHDAGATVMPAMPAFYYAPKKIDDLIEQFAFRVLAQLGLPQEKQYRWKGGKD